MQQPRARVEHVHEPVGGARDEERVVHIPREQPPVRRRVRGRAPQRHGLRVVVAWREQAEVVVAPDSERLRGGAQRELPLGLLGQPPLVRAREPMAAHEQRHVVQPLHPAGEPRMRAGEPAQR